MAYIDRVNRKLRRKFGGRVRAVEKEGTLVLEGELEKWEDLVAAGTLAFKRRYWRGPQGGRGYRGLVNDIRFTGGAIPPMEVPALRDTSLEGLSPDVLVIGAGVVGCAIARELSRCDLDILLVDKEHDVGLHASSRNDGMVHPGIDLRKGSLKHHYNRRGNALYPEITRELGVDFERTGQLLCFSNPLWKPLLYLTLVYWKWLGIPGVRVIGREELHRREPGLKEDLGAALFFPTAGIVCPYNLTIAYAENAVQNGVRLSLDTAVLGMSREEGRITGVETNRGRLCPRLVVNAAGVFAEDIAAMGGDRFYSIHPRRGTNMILDKKTVPALVGGIVSKIGSLGKNVHTKGGGMVRTVHGNLLVGPDAVETFDREDFATRPESIEGSLEKFKNTSPGLDRSWIITYFTGVRAPTYEEDFVVCKGEQTGNLIHTAGIQSPGLTAAPAIAQDAARFAVEILTAAGRAPAKRKNFDPRRAPIPHAAALGEAERRALIAQNPDYGVILCRCEEVSRGEILDSLRRPVPCDTLDGVKRRVRPGMGRCQGGFCGPLVLGLIAEEKGLAPEEVLKSGPGSAVLCGPIKATPIKAAPVKAGPLKAGGEASYAR